AEPSIEVHGLGNALKSIATMGTRAKDIRPARDPVRRIFLESNKRHLASPGWEPLAQTTIDEKHAKGLPSKPEYRTGALYRSLTEQKAKGQKNAGGKTKMVFGSRLFYAAWQQGTKHQPKRDLIDLSPADRKRMADKLSKYVSRGQLT